MKIEVVQYRTEWPKLFKNEAALLQKLLAPLSPAIEHMGSTAVPELAAKPVIDVLVGLNNSLDLDQCVSLFLKEEYIYYKGYESVMPFRRLFVKSTASFISTLDSKTLDVIPINFNPERSHHIHVVLKDSDFWKRHILFRNHLRSNEQDRIAYGNLKLKLSNCDFEHRADYNKAKESLILEIQQRAGWTK